MQPIVDGRVEAVMGSRFLLERLRFFGKGAKSPFFSHYIGNKLIVAITNGLYRHSATDYEAALRPSRRGSWTVSRSTPTSLNTTTS